MATPTGTPSPEFEQTVILPDLREMSAEELMSFTSEEFTETLIERSRVFGTDMFDRRKYSIEELEEEDYRERLIEWNQRHAWIEWWLGVPPPSKQLVVLPNEDMPIKIRIAQQVIDEVKHQRVFSKRVTEMGGKARLAEYQPTPLVYRIYETTFDFEDPLDIAVSLQCTGEPALLNYIEPENSITPVLVDEKTFSDMLNDVIIDEPRHVKVGEDLLIKYCNTPEKRRRAVEVHLIKLDALMKHYLEDLELLGAKRIAPLPVF